MQRTEVCDGLAAVQDQQRRPVLEVSGQPGHRGPGGAAADPEPGPDERGDRLSGGGAEQVDPGDAVGESVAHLVGEGSREARLADTRGAGQREQPALGRQQREPECRELLVAPEQRGSRPPPHRRAEPPR